MMYKEYELDESTFMGAWYMPEDICDDILDTFKKNKHMWSKGAVLETAEANVTPPSIRDADGNSLDGTVRLHLVTTPIKFYLDGTQFVALTIKANYPSPADFVSHKRATMIINRVVDYDEREEQSPDITAP